MRYHMFCVKLTPFRVMLKVWNQQDVKKDALHVWKPVPVSMEFVALGMVATISPEPPSVMIMRCVPKQWVTPSSNALRKVWESSAVGGRIGNLWTGGSLQTMVMSVGNSGGSTSETTYDLKSKKFCIQDLV